MSDCPDCGAPLYEGGQHLASCPQRRPASPMSEEPLPLTGIGPRRLHGPGYCPECSEDENTPIYHT